jgi:tryptophan 2-C-methyltransferase
MKKALVTLVNPNKIFPAITPYALDILTTSLEQDGFEVEVVDLTFRRARWREVLHEYFAERRPLLVGVTVRNTDTIYPQEQKVFIGEHREIIDEIKSVCDAPIVAGGVGFSSMPFALVDYFDIPFGVKGPGELIICKLANALRSGGSPAEVPGLIFKSERGVEQVPDELNGSNGHAPQPVQIGGGNVHRVNRATPYTRRSGVPLKIDNLEYYRRGGLGNILTKNGCPFACTHCVEPDAKGNLFATRTSASVVDELESLTAQGVHDVHSTDSEFNLNIGHSKGILREIIARKNSDPRSPLHQLRLWVYTQPVPFDEEYASLLAQAGCRGVNVSPDHTRDELLDAWKVTGAHTRYYTFADVENMTRLLSKYGIMCMIEILLGMPGETLDTLTDCLDKTLALDSTVVGYTLGIRVFPYSPLGLKFAEESAGHKVIRGLQSNNAISPILLKPLRACADRVEYERQFMFDEFGRLRPLYFFSPELPEDAETIESPSGRWLKTLQFMRDYIPEEEHYRVMLPTAPGLTKDDNNYADNPFLVCLTQLGYKGAFWSRWRQRDQIIQEAAEKGLGNIALA